MGQLPENPIELLDDSACLYRARIQLMPVLEQFCSAPLDEDSVAGLRFWIDEIYPPGPRRPASPPSRRTADDDRDRAPGGRDVPSVTVESWRTRRTVTSGGEGSRRGLPSWTAGEDLAARGTRLLLWAALAAGPVALFLQYTSSPAAPATIATAAPDRTAARTAAGEAAQTWVVSWLTTPSTGAAALTARYPQLGAPLVLPAVPARADRPSVAAATPGADGAWTVVVGVDVTENGQTAPIRRWYQVPVRWDDDRAAVLSLPAPVAGPVDGTAPASGYTARVDVTSAAGTTVSAFLGALLAGQSDVTRFVAPSTQSSAATQIRPVTPPIARTVRLGQLLARGDVTDATLVRRPDGASARVLATVDLLDASEAARTSQYALTLTSRAGRWEIAGIDLSPLPPEPATP